MDYQLKRNINNPETVLKRYLYWAIYVPEGSPQPDPAIINQPELAHYVVDWGKSDDRASFAVQEDVVIGVCWSRCFSADEPGYGFISPDIPEISLAIHPDDRSRGIGTELLSELIEILRIDYPAVSLSVSPGNPAIRLYRRAGFSIHTADQDQLIMIKYLSFE